MTVRADRALYERGLASSRTHAQRIIEEGRARRGGQPIGRPSTPIAADDVLEVVDVPEGGEYASRGAHKLVSALEAFQVSAAERVCLDAGASTGGFTDVLLRQGASLVYAVDVGHDQLVPRLAEDARVSVMDGLNLRELTPDRLGQAPSLIVSDVSFISLTTILEPLSACLADGGEMVLMVKPQFEVGKAKLPKSGVVREPAQQADAVAKVVRAASGYGLETLGVSASSLPGQDGNREFFLHLRAALVAKAEANAVAYEMIEDAVHGGHR
ncbi:TlyA family RNA methyltransferase [Dermabacteraceae bacterium P7074]